MSSLGTTKHSQIAFLIFFHSNLKSVGKDQQLGLGADQDKDPKLDSVPKQEQQEIVLATTGVKATNTMLGEETSNSDRDTIPQLDGPGESKLFDLPFDKTDMEKEDEPVICNMLENSFAEAKFVAPGVNPPARVFHPELGIGKNTVKTEWHDSFWYEYIFEASNFQMEMYQVKE